jgi:S-adenosylmethionine-diacylgycerolhomoserine-N-methlytransferase
MSLLSDLKVLYHLALKPVRGASHEDRLESFYAGQASAYDEFRKRLLQGRQELWSDLRGRVDGGVWIDMGGGTGSNLEYFADEMARWEKIYVVDLSSSLLEVAKERAEQNGWDNVEVVHADATTFRLERPADVVTFSYSLTMIPDWFAAIDAARANLRDDGLLGVVDFFISRKYAADGNSQHGWLTRTGWPTWFGNDNVYLSPDHLPYLQRRFNTLQLDECRAKVPYIPLARVPYYRFIGCKQQVANSNARLAEDRISQVSNNV